MKKSELPLITVVVPCRNDASTIDAALDAMVAQTYPNLEIIVVDDFSDDNLEAVAKPYLHKYDHVRMISSDYDDPKRLNNQGVDINAGWSARNAGVKAASGELITFQDADDGSLADRIAIQYEALLAHDAWHVNVDCQQFDDKKNGKLLGIKLEDADILSQDETLAWVKSTQYWPWPVAFPTKLGFLRGLIGDFIEKYHPRDWTPYPMAANNCLVKKEVFNTCLWRPLQKRTRPSRRGRGADRDFNGLVAEVYKKSIGVRLPLYLWRT